MFLLAQAARRKSDDGFVPFLLIPVGLGIVFIGVLAIRRREIYFRKWGITVRGLPAVLMGGLLAVLGVGVVLAGISFFFR